MTKLTKASKTLQRMQAAFFAEAVNGDDGCVPTYMIEDEIWEIINPAADDDGDACDWDNPISVKEYSDVDVD